MCNGYVTIRNGIDANSPILGDGQYCGSTETEIPQTSSNRAFVRFKTDHQLMHSFKLHYREVQHECGGEIRLTHQISSTTVATPNYPNVPHPSIECIWKIHAPLGERIRIDFNDKFDLSSDDHCSKEYVEVRDGFTSYSPLIGTFCYRKPSTQRSTSNAMLIKFFTDVPEPKNGFKVSIAIDVCGGSLTSFSGYLTSPNYPAIGAYPNQAKCDYRITGFATFFIEIKLIDVNLPPPINETHCDLTKDHLVLYSGFPESLSGMTEIATLCGNITSRTYIADGQKLLVRMNTFSKTKRLYRGFRLHYNTTYDNACGGFLFGEEGVITSPSYPSKTLKTMFCKWKITVPKGRRVKLEFLDVSLLILQFR